MPADLQFLTRATFAVVLTDLRQPRPMSVGRPSQLWIFVMSRSRLVLDQSLLANSSRKLR